MKANQLKWMVGMLALAAGTTLAQVKEPTLKVGDPAPKLQASKWVQGDPVKEFSPDTAYIVEFWATWCGPCRVSIPHLNEIYQRFKDKGLVVIGQDVWEQDTAAVAPFVKKMGKKMTYRVALDTVPEGEKAKGKMAETWMEAAGQNGIPTAFVVNKQGKIAWIGHPMELKDSVLEQVLDGTYDLNKAAAAYEQRLKNQEQLRALNRELSQSMRTKDWDKAESTLAAMAKLMPEDELASLDMMRFRILLSREDYPGAFKLAGKLSEANKDNPMLQNQLAWELASREGVKEPDLDLLQKIAVRANTAAKGQDPAILDTLARVLFMKGEKAKAIETQQKAVKLADDNMKGQLQKVLDSYKDGKLPAAD